MEKCNIKILDLSETHQRDKGYFNISTGNQIMCLKNSTNYMNSDCRRKMIPSNNRV